MKIKVIGLLGLIAIGLYSCRTEEIETYADDASFVKLNLETFIPDPSMDNTVKGKYVGIIGHHTNPAIHGKIFINSGQHGQYNALVQMTDDSRLKFVGTPQNRDASIVHYKGDNSSFTVNFENHNKAIVSAVRFEKEENDGYIVLQKTIKGVDAFVLTGTYVDSSNPAFTGNWDLMGDGTVTIIPVQIDVPTFPLPITINVPTENIGTLSVSHTGSAAPLLDTSFETNTTLACIGDMFPTANFPTVPFIIPSDITGPTGGFLGGEGSVSAGGQSSLFNGSTSSWTLSYGDPIPAANFPGGFTDDSCMPTASGTWSWNGRTGTISIEGI